MQNNKKAFINVKAFLIVIFELKQNLKELFVTN